MIVEIDISSEKEAYELIYMLFMRKFYSDDTLGPLSIPMNDVIRDCVEFYPNISSKFETKHFIDRACDLFLEECRTTNQDPNLWKFLLDQEEKQQLGKKYAKDFFLPIQPKRQFLLTSPEEVVDAIKNS